MLVFATSDKGGTGRSVTSCNIAYRTAKQGRDTCYLDFDFGSPTAGAVFSIPSALRGVADGGLHSYLAGTSNRTAAIDVWRETDRDTIRGRPDGAGRLVLYPGDIGGGEFAPTPETIQRCARLLLRLEEEFSLVLVDLSAGRSHALDTVLAATALPRMRKVTCRWLVFHRWTRQHIIAAEGLVFGENGMLFVGEDRGHNRAQLARRIRFVRTAVVDPDSNELAGLRAEQIEWLRNCNIALQNLAGQLKVGRVNTLGDVPMDPVLQWREQLLTDYDTLGSQIANQATVEAFESLSKRLVEDAAWEGL
jgi:hypothetical protein